MKRLSFLLIFSLLTLLSFSQAKYIFYFIGDGMGPNQVLAAEMYQAAVDGVNGCTPLCMTQFPYSGQATTFSASDGITDSAAAVPIFAIGVGAEYFTGWHDNSEIAPLIYQAVLH